MLTNGKKKKSQAYRERKREGERKREQICEV